MINIDNIKIKCRPDFNRVLKVLKRQGKPDRVPFYELFSNIHEKVVGHKIKKQECKDDVEYEYLLRAYYNEHLGYDYLEIFSPYYFPAPNRKAGDCGRGYVQGGDSLIGSWEEYERYPWPKYKDINWSNFERVKDYLPDGMKCIALSPGGIEEAVILNIMGYEKLCMALYENPALVQKVFDNVGLVWNICLKDTFRTIS